MKTRKQIRRKADKVVAVRVGRKKVDGKFLFFLFTARQVEEVLADINLSPLPFAPTFLTGICNWRGHIAPVVDLEQRFGFAQADTIAKGRYLVVRMGTTEGTDKGEMLRCVVRVSSQIHTQDVSASSVPVSADQIGVEPSLVMGAFEENEDFFIVPDLISILKNQRKTELI
jgi:purine-binding chemotaxis protein CheW